FIFYRYKFEDKKIRNYHWKGRFLSFPLHGWMLMISLLTFDCCYDSQIKISSSLSPVYVARNESIEKGVTVIIKLFIPRLDDATNQFVGKINKYSSGSIRNNELHLHATIISNTENHCGRYNKMTTRITYKINT
ncbi:Protein of unknown function, partial [Cotesia congregata]